MEVKPKKVDDKKDTLVPLRRKNNLNLIQESIEKNEFAFYVKDLIKTQNFYFYSCLVMDSLKQLRSASLLEIKNSIFEAYKDRKINLPAEQKATLTRRISEVLNFGMKENYIVQINNKYSFTYGMDKDGWPENSKSPPKNHTILIYGHVYFSKLTSEQKVEISFPLHYKLLEKYAQRKMLYEISKALYGQKDKRTQHHQFVHKYEEQSLQLHLALIEKAGFLKEFYNHLEQFESNKSTEINKLTSGIYKKLDK